MKAERECKGCEGTGCSVHETPSRAHRFYLGCDCPACLGTGRVTDHIPVADAVADAETLRQSPWAVYVGKGSIAVHIGRAEDNAAAAAADDSPEDAAFHAVWAARAAFRAVPGLRD